MKTYELLHKILGPEVYNLTEKEMALAKKVAVWFCAPADMSEARVSGDDIVRACRYALERDGTNWDDIMLPKTRRRDIIYRKYAIISIVWERTGCTQERKALLLGGRLDRTALIHAVKAADDWRKYDPFFAQLYARITNYVNEYLDNK